MPLQRQSASSLDWELKLKLTGAFAAILFIILAVPLLLNLDKNLPTSTTSSIEDNSDGIREKNTEKRIPSENSATITKSRRPASLPKFHRSDEETKFNEVHTPIYREDLEVPQEDSPVDQEEQHFQEVTQQDEPQEVNESEERSPASSENSLVPKSKENPDGEQSVDDFMAGSETPPVVEEASVS